MPPSPRKVRSILIPPGRAVVLVLSILSGFQLGGCYRGVELMPTPRVLVDTNFNPFDRVPPEQRSNKVDVLYATDRLPATLGTGKLNYTYDRSPSLAWGSCVVEIGKKVPWNSLVQSTSVLRRTLSLPLAIESITERGRFPETPWPLVRTEDGITTDSPKTLALVDEANRAFLAEIHRRLEGAGRKEVFLFVHGYNNTFRDATFTIAQIWHFLGRQGVPIAYSWPAGAGGVRGYTQDSESGQYTNYHFKSFIRLLASSPDVEKIHIIAHSRGTDVATTGLRELVLESRARGNDPLKELKIANLVLAAPDLDLQVTQQKVMAERLPLAVGQVTMYVSPGDRALGISDWLVRGVTRVGRMGESDFSETMKENLKSTQGVTIINVPERIGAIGHAYFHDDPRVSGDMSLLLGAGRPAGAEFGRPLTPIFPGFWSIPKDYMAHAVPVPVKTP